MAKKTGKRRLSKPGWCEVVAIGASAGGLLALGQLLGNLDAEFPPILIVQHLDPRHKSQLARLLARKTRKSIKEAEDGEPITAGMTYIRPPDEHLLVAQGRIQLAHSRLIRFSRPSIERSFHSRPRACEESVWASRRKNTTSPFIQRAENKLGALPRLAQDPN